MTPRRRLHRRSAILLRRTLIEVFRDWISISNAITGLSLLLLLLLVSWFGLGSSEHDHFDTGLYYLTTIRWAQDYPVVPGLANLHTRLGFNQSLFLFVRTTILAVVLFIPWAARGVILTGYPFYPSALVRFRTDWTVPKKTADSDRDWRASLVRCQRILCGRLRSRADLTHQSSFFYLRRNCGLVFADL
jgi:hypothetical protein